MDTELVSGKEVLVERCGNGSLKNGHWTVVGKLPVFNRAEWPIPLFLSSNNANNSLRAVTVSEEDLVTEILAVQAIPGTVRGYANVVGGMTSPEWSVEAALQSGGAMLGTR